MTWLACAVFAAPCVTATGDVDLVCLGGTAGTLRLKEHAVGGPGGSAGDWVRARYPSIAGCLAALPEKEGAAKYDLHLDATFTVVRIERDPSPQITANIDDCVEQLFVGQKPPGVTNSANPFHFTLSYSRSPVGTPSLATDLDRLCAVAGQLGPGASLMSLVTEWSLDERGSSILGKEAEAVRSAVEREPRDRLYASLVREAAARGVTWTCPALEVVLRTN